MKSALEGPLVIHSLAITDHYMFTALHVYCIPHSAPGTRGSTPPKPLLSWGPHGRAGGRKEDEGGESGQLGFYVRAQDSYVAERDDGDS